MSIEFNASISVTELLMKTLENCAKDLAQRCIREASLRHGFDADEEIRILGLENLSIIRKQMVKKTVEKPEKQDKKKKEKVSDVKKTIKPSFPVPFIKELVNSEGCQGLAYNRGLFTQCPKNRMENGSYCKGCQLEADNNASGCPECGTVESRLAADLYAFKDPQGRSPVSYVKVLNKLKLSSEFVVEESGKLNIIIPNEHFVDEKVKSSSSRGRPKKVGVVEVDSVTDLFAKLTCETEYDDVLDELLDNNDNKSEKSNISDITDDNSDKSEDKKSKKSEKSSNKLTDEEKEIKKAQLEQERANRKAEREQKLIAEKEEKEAKRIAEKEKKDAEKEAEKEAKRLAEIAEKEKKIAEKEAKRLAEIAEKEKKEAEKEAKRLADIAEKEKKIAEKEAEKEAKRIEKEKKEAEKEAKKLEKEKKDSSKKTPKQEEKKVETPKQEEKKVETPKQEETKTETPTKLSVKKIQIGDKIYLKSSVNILYDPDTKEEVGLWNPETKTIEELPEEDEEEEEDEYESDDE